MTDQQFEELCKTYGFAPSRDLRSMLEAALMWKRKPAEECPSCEYNKERAANWRREAYKLGGTPLPGDKE